MKEQVAGNRYFKWVILYGCPHLRMLLAWPALILTAFLFYYFFNMLLKGLFISSNQLLHYYIN
jgi:hypothetical protein